MFAMKFAQKPIVPVRTVSFSQRDAVLAIALCLTIHGDDAHLTETVRRCIWRLPEDNWPIIDMFLRTKHPAKMAKIMLEEIEP